MSTATQSQRPNLIFITCDQLRMDTLGCYGDSCVKTPNIDRIARTGTRFTRSFVSAPLCAPNRASIATGRFPSVHGLRFNGTHLPLSEVTLMEVLRTCGYETCGAGKMHFEPQWRTLGDGVANPRHEDAINPQPAALPWYGFDRVQLSEDNRVGPYADYLKEHGYDTWDDLHSFSYPQHACQRSAFPSEHHQTNWIADRSIDMVKGRQQDKPLFLWTSFVDPHHPFTPPYPYDEMYDPAQMPLPKFDPGEVALWPEKYRRKYTDSQSGHEAIGMDKLRDADWQKIRAYYYGMITCIDDAIGRLLDVVERELGLENTIICFTADHGEMLGDHHLLFKGTMYDEVTRVPLLVSGKGIEARQVCDELTCTVDLMPTFLDLAGADIPAGVQGKSFADMLKGNRLSIHDAVFMEDAAGCRTLWNPEARVSWNSCEDSGELYDHSRDPDCFCNLWNNPDASELKEAMMGQLVDAIIGNVDPLPERIGMC